MADRALSILQHTLGVDQYGQGRQYRNHFVTGEESDDYPTCVDLVARGLMTRRRGNAITGGDDVFYVTDAGKQYVADNSPPVPKVTRSEARYQRYLDSDGAFVDFKHFLLWEANQRRRGLPC